MNFAEELVYWYLRFNGFFPLTNFVLHHSNDHRTSDADILAVRFPYVSEAIGGNPDDWDPQFRNRWDIDLTTETIGLITEVKSGSWDPADLNDQAPTWRVREGLKRIGMLPEGDLLEEATRNLRSTAKTRVGSFTLAKLFVANGEVPGETPWLHLELNNVEAFVQERMRRYRQRKLADRLFFGGDLIQYLAWKGGGDRD